MFDKILVANRGEIARRIFRACGELDVRTVAIYSDEDRSAPWARQADEGFLLAGSSAQETYLNQEAIFKVAKASGASAIHPGYGFLSENPEFAAACRERGLAFIGPSAESMRALGNKASAREIAGQAGVPIIPGFDGAAYGNEELKDACAALGYPILIKASGGGGGMGMRIVESAAGFNDALRAARREALSAFGSDHVLVEKYFDNIRHVEIQVIGDMHGNLVHLFERECSIQRRHQKILEESPSPAVTLDLRSELTTAALALARAVGYVNAGTLEFILTSQGEFYFLEMNTRLQVEHPITELVTGLDIVKWQIRVAAGQSLDLQPPAPRMRGHAIECRVYAEDPANAFMPSTGEISFYRAAVGPGVRVDDGIESGAKIGPFYDPLLAKVVVLGADRRDAIGKMIRALQDTVILGVTTNIPYLLDIVEHPDFLEGNLSTGFLQEHLHDWSPAWDSGPSSLVAMGAFEEELARRRSGAIAGDGNRGPASNPWATNDSWRNVD